MAVHAWGSSFGAIFAGLAAAVLVSLILSLLLGLLSLRVKAIFFALVTLAVAFAFLSLITQLYTFTGEIGRAHVCTPVTNTQLVCRLLLENENKVLNLIRLRTKAAGCV